ncbi:hypothetical protein LX80_02108 [Hydrotalea sandarakina]|jgi:hypothetical protein|uniref:Uncharacterized protein n=2 Tax=Hydrotalea sandarakina TaxID=1004304 RepID=A0A2W7RNH6_9BACT|nr:hypothetical protein LX80_02108 [Hydrotalea sandarakina]
MINMKYFLIAIFLLFCNISFSQSSKALHQIKPKWKLGDVKKIHAESYSKVFIKDSLFNNTEAKADYYMKVTDTTKNYTILYYSEPNTLDIKTNTAITKVDSAVNIFTKIFKNIEKETKYFQYELLVDKNTGQAFKVKNSDKLLELIEKVTSTIIDEFGQKIGKTSIQIDSMKQKLVSNFKTNEPKILETIINEYNYVMGAYSLTFPYNSSVSQNVMVYDVNAMSEFGDIEMPAVITTSSKKNDDNLIVNTDIDYDKEFLLEQIKKKYKNMNDLTTDDIFLSEKTETSFTTTTNWIISQKSDVVFKTKEVKVINATSVTFQ